MYTCKLNNPKYSHIHQVNLSLSESTKYFFTEKKSHPYSSRKLNPTLEDMSRQFHKCVFHGCEVVPGYTHGDWHFLGVSAFNPAQLKIVIRKLPPKKSNEEVSIKQTMHKSPGIITK